MKGLRLISNWEFSFSPSCSAFHAHPHPHTILLGLGPHPFICPHTGPCTAMCICVSRPLFIWSATCHMLLHVPHHQPPSHPLKTIWGVPEGTLDVPFWPWFTLRMPPSGPRAHSFHPSMHLCASIFNITVSPGNRPAFYFYFHPGLGPMFSSIHTWLHVTSPSHHLSLTHHLGHQQFIQSWTSNNFDPSGLCMPFSFHFISTSTPLAGACQHCHLLHLWPMTLHHCLQPHIPKHTFDDSRSSFAPFPLLVIKMVVVWENCLYPSNCASWTKWVEVKCYWKSIMFVCFTYLFVF